MNTLKDNHSSLADVLAAIRELEMAQRCVCVGGENKGVNGVDLNSSGQEKWFSLSYNHL